MRHFGGAKKLGPDCTFIHCLRVYLLLVFSCDVYVIKLHPPSTPPPPPLGKGRVNHLKIKEWIDSSISQLTVLQELDKRPTLSDVNQTKNRRRYVNFQNGSHFICNLILIILS